MSVLMLAGQIEVHPAHTQSAADDDERDLDAEMPHYLPGWGPGPARCAR